MKIFVISLAIVLSCLLSGLFVGGTPALSQAAGGSAAPPSANRFSSAPSAGGAGTASTPAKTAAGRRAAAVSNAAWYTLALAAFLSLRYLFWILGFTATFCVLSLIFAHAMYRNHQPLSAHGVARWSVFWALLVCSLLPLLLPFIFAWSWIAWLMVSFPFTVLTLILLMILLVNRPAHSS